MKSSRLKQRGVGALISLAVCLALSGYASLLPTATDETRMVWREFDEARRAIKQIEPRQTRRAELLSDRFDPYRNPAVSILSWPELLQKFATAEIVKTGILDTALRDCLAVGARCNGLATFNYAQSAWTPSRLGRFLGRNHFPMNKTY